MPSKTPEGIAPEYLDMVITCPFEAGQAEGAMPIRDVLASDIGPKIMPHIMENIKNAEELRASGIDPERATVIAFGGAVVQDEAGAIMRMPEPTETAVQLQREPRAAEKK